MWIVEERCRMKTGDKDVRVNRYAVGANTWNESEAIESVREAYGSDGSQYKASRSNAHEVIVLPSRSVKPTASDRRRRVRR